MFYTALAVAAAMVATTALASVAPRDDPVAGSESEAEPGSAAPGTYVRIGDHRLHLHCVGAGTPAVVFDSGLGGSSLEWYRVQPEVARFTRACVYDRAGYGWSDGGPGPRDSETIVAELNSLLGYGSVPAPYVLVGHSFGGFNVRLYASEYPDKTSGLVLIDSSHEDQFRRFAQAGLPAPAPQGSQFILGNPNAVPAELPEGLRALARSFTLRGDFQVALRSELMNMQRSAGELSAAPPLPDVPLVVISRRVDTGQRSTRRDKVWLDMQQELAGRTNRSQLIIADTPDHYIQLRQPSVVVAAIRNVVEATRTAAQAM